MNDQALVQELEKRITELEVLNNQFQVIQASCTLGWIDPVLVASTRVPARRSYVAVTQKGDTDFQLTIGTSLDTQVFLLGAIYFESIPHCILKTSINAAGHQYNNVFDNGELQGFGDLCATSYNTRRSALSIPAGYKIIDGEYVKVWLNVSIVNKEIVTAFADTPTAPEYTLTVPLWLRTYDITTE